MRNQIIAVLMVFIFCVIVLVSAKPTGSVEKQHRTISFSNWPQISNPFCIPVLCTFPCRCGSQLDMEGCETCYCLPCDLEW